MGQSIILLINELAPNQTNAYQSVNDAVAALETASNEPLAFDATAGGDLLVPLLDMLRYSALRVSGHAAQCNIVFSNEVNATPDPTKRVIGIINEEAFPLKVWTTEELGYVIVPPFSSKIVQIDGDDVLPLAAVPPHTVGVYSFGTPGVSDIMLRYNFVETVEYQDDFLASVGEIGVNPTATFTMIINKNGSPVGEVEIDTSGVFTFATTGAEVLFDYGDVLTVEAPATPDATAAGISFTLLGKRL